MKYRSLIALAGLCCVASAANAQFTDFCADAPEVGAGMYTYDITIATPDGTSACGASASGADAWIKYLPPGSGTANATTCGLAGHDTVLAVFDACGGTEVACLDDSCGLQTSLNFAVNAGFPVWIRIAGFAGGVGSGAVMITDPVPPPPGSWNEAGDAGSLPTDAQTPTGDGPLSAILGNIVSSGDVDMFLINICDFGAFSATTVNNATAGDTQLFVFNTDGMGLFFNDDDPLGAGGLRSRLSQAFLSSNGDYYLAVARYNCDPLDEGSQLLWANTPFNVERAPDGPGAANPVAFWSGASGTGTYQVNLTGVCFPGGGGGCDPDFNQDGVADQDDVAYLRNVVAGGENPTGRDPDFNQDGVADQDDVAALINVIAGGECP